MPTILIRDIEHKENISLDFIAINTTICWNHGVRKGVALNANMDMDMDMDMDIKLEMKLDTDMK